MEEEEEDGEDADASLVLSANREAIGVVERAGAAIAEGWKRAGEAIAQGWRPDAIAGAMSDAIEDSTNAVERATGLDLDGDGDVGLKGHDHRDRASAAEPPAPLESPRP